MVVVLRIPILCLFLLLTATKWLVVPVYGGAYYTVYDDASWAVVDKKLSNDVLGSDRQGVYDTFIDNCREMAGPQRAASVCDSDENFRLQMNMYQPRSVNNYTAQGFKKIKAPKEVTEVLLNFWNANKDEAIIEWGSASPYHNTWDTEPTIISIENEKLQGGGYALRAQVANYIRDEMEKWTGMKQAISSVYGIRAYHNGSILAPHLDRFPLVSSAILNVAQDVVDDWPLEVYDHDGVAHNVTMAAGDLVLYESHSVIHGRPFPLNGNFYANIFVHFEPIGPLNATTIDYTIHDDITYPPYVIPGSSWDPEWRENNPDGWNLLEDTARLVRDGDLSTIQYAAKVNPNLHWNGTKEWTPIHEAVRHGHYDIVKFLVEELHVNLDTICYEYDGTPYKLALHKLGVDHRVTHYLRTLRNEIEGDEIVPVKIRYHKQFDDFADDDTIPEEDEEWLPEDEILDDEEEYEHEEDGEFYQDGHEEEYDGEEL